MHSTSPKKKKTKNFTYLILARSKAITGAEYHMSTAHFLANFLTLFSYFDRKSFVSSINLFFKSQERNHIIQSWQEENRVTHPFRKASCKRIRYVLISSSGVRYRQVRLWWPGAASGWRRLCWPGRCATVRASPAPGPR